MTTDRLLGSKIVRVDGSNLKTGAGFLRKPRACRYLGLEVSVHVTARLSEWATSSLLAGLPRSRRAEGTTQGDPRLKSHPESSATSHSAASALPKGG